MTETWKDIPGYEGAYQASDLGRVRSLDRIDSYSRRRKGRVLRPARYGRGVYFAVTLPDSSKTVHSLVLRTFVGPRPAGCDVLHLDHNPANNRLDNLRYGTRSENLRMDYDAEKRLRRAKPVVGTPLNGGAQLRFANQRQAGAALGISPSAISQAIHGHIKSSAGHAWRFA